MQQSIRLFMLLIIGTFARSYSLESKYLHLNKFSAGIYQTLANYEYDVNYPVF